MDHRPSVALDPNLTACEGHSIEPLVQERSILSASLLPAVVVGELVAMLEKDGSPLVVYPGQPEGAVVQARSTVTLDGSHIGCAVVLAFEYGDATRPIVMGVMRHAGDGKVTATTQFNVEADGARLVVEARKQLVLKCGDASITLTEAGKVLIQGKFISSRSAGVNRIAGGSIQLN